MKLTEQNWKQKFKSRFIKNEGSIVGDYELWDHSEDPEEAIKFIQSLIASIKQEERDRYEALIINTHLLTDNLPAVELIPFASAIRQFKSKLIQSLTEEDVKNLK